MKRTSLVFLSILFVLALSSLACQSFVRLAQEQPPVVETVCCDNTCRARCTSGSDAAVCARPGFA
jgi:hypothetical protein